MTAAGKPAPTNAAAALWPGLDADLVRLCNAGFDTAIAILNVRISGYHAHRLAKGYPMGVIEAELRDIAETLQKRRRAG